MTLVAQLATLGNSVKLRKYKMAAAKIYHGATYPKIMCNTSSIYRVFGYVESISGIIFTIWGHV